MPWYHPAKPFVLYVSRSTPSADVCLGFAALVVALRGVCVAASCALASRSFSETKCSPDSCAGSEEATTLAYEVGAVGSVALPGGVVGAVFENVRATLAGLAGFAWSLTFAWERAKRRSGRDFQTSVEGDLQRCKGR
jgi:hypothetical protein